ncbi:hypothetical protein [Bradyrhizobium stylosanthis]|uniref:hypothetical protein n=1 Tax=Bradyrhizobium stylosanthis TaxID=1803665 RepID=UPI0016480B1A|nr:hypothetical protein [Bradyrhizobium stylosanthis]
MALAARQAMEPFAERVCRGNARTADDLYRFGYRVGETGTVVAAIEVPARLLEEAISSNLTSSCRLTPDGNLISESSFEYGNASAAMSIAPMPLDQLIRATLAPQNLHMEEATVSNLRTMLQRLEEATSVVRETLARYVQDEESK